ncbi:hypothetical protein EOPP23_07355 [Endozoicomonas sp. OPT23]|uniref:multiheme c-type cytochrome n=1 Tax=Endozoicomonas sp. OPT23 TaxID=2072845 RepID=UPI00129AECFD|nr:multiheme c-type cytochrome [Endozoicomonas sp. OPT23]MRI32799.1 hypothetical protein [Endozoicomonas sp. OPT23]
MSGLFSGRSLKGGLKRCLAPLSLCLLTVLPSAQAADKSTSIRWSEDKTRIYSSNFDGGSVSIIDRDSGELLNEAVLGRDIRRLAFNSDQSRLLVSDYLSDEVILLDGQSLKEIKRIKTPARPFGVLFDETNNQYYVTSFEGHKLLVISSEGDIRQTIEVEETPRGLALTDDHRLLITHSLNGQVSIFDVSTSSPKLSKIIQLIDTPTVDKATTPQGKPRLLDNIAISPDGKQAWLPHVLWSFSRDFQFQSTVFPAISILDLTPGKEHELVQQRKQLFKQINIVESGNRTRIVSNPHDAVYSDDGKKLFISLAGSEDLMVFDLSRQGSLNKKRHRRKKFQGGAKATQIYRNIPGDNPRGLLINGDDLFVQNAMSLNLVKFTTGGQGPFAKAKVKNKDFSTLVSKDPLSPEVRLGKTLFNSGNTLDNPEYPMAGDFWMSCNSCHFDGFNFTNKQLMADGQKDKKVNALTGHRDVVKMIAGDPVGAYVDMVQKTQGGMGANPAFSDVEKIDVNNPPTEVVRMMSALNQYIKTQENLPYLSTWLRLDDKKKFTHKEEWLNSASCESCHTSIYNQWADSNHGMNMDNPYYRQHEDFAAKVEGEDFRQFCRGCHTPQMIMNGFEGPFRDHGDMHEKRGQSLLDAFDKGEAVNEAGTGCFFCHRVTKAEDAGGNADMTINLKDRQGYIFEESTQAVGQWLAERQINALPETHKESYSNKELYNSSLYCATCHNEFTPGPGAIVNDNYNEWQKSEFFNPEDPSKNKTCIDCHMTADVVDFDNRVGGQSTNDGPMKKDVRVHYFTGGNYYFTGLRNPEHAKLSKDMLKGAVKMVVDKSDNLFSAKITNTNAGHAMPGGARRQVWLEIIATDANGKTVFESGVMKDGVIPKDSRKFIQIKVDKDGKPVGQRFWRYEKIGKDTRIQAGETRTETFELPKDIQYPVTVSTRMLYQVFAKALTEKVRKYAPDVEIPEPEIVEIKKIINTFEE